MQTDQTETISFVKVGFSEEEFKLLLAKVRPPLGLASFIHDVVVRSLRRKPIAKKGVQP